MLYFISAPKYTHQTFKSKTTLFCKQSKLVYHLSHKCAALKNICSCLCIFSVWICPLNIRM